MISYDDDMNLMANHLQNEIVGYVKSTALIIAIKHKFATYISNIPIRIEDLATTLSFDPHPLARLLKLLESMQLLSIDDQNNTVKSNKYTNILSKISGDYFYLGYLACEEFLHSLIHNKECLSIRCGETFYTYVSRNKSIGEDFARYCEATGKEWLQSVINMLDLSQYETIVDVGGGNGYFLSMLLSKYSSLKGKVFDLPNRIIEAQSFSKSLPYSIQQRLDLIDGDFFKNFEIFADAYILCRVLLNWSDFEANKILLNISKTMTSKSELLVIDFIVPDKEHSQLQRSLLHDINLLALFGGAIRNLPQWKKLLHESNFTVIDWQITTEGIHNEPNVPFVIIRARKSLTDS